MEIELIEEIKDKLWEILLYIHKLEKIQKNQKESCNIKRHNGSYTKQSIRVKSIELQKLFFEYRKLTAPMNQKKI